MEKKKERCPKCGGEEVRSYVYGLLRFSSEAEKNRFEKEHISAGCMIRENDPVFHCDHCGEDFGNRSEKGI